MKKIILATVAVFMISLFTLSACFPSEVPAVETEMPALANTVMPEPTLQAVTPEASPTVVMIEELQPSPTETSSLRGQVALVSNGTIWLYNLETESLVEVATVSPEDKLGKLEISEDGNWLAYNTQSTLFVQRLSNGDEYSLTETGSFLGWSDQSGQFYSVLSHGQCEDIFDNLEDQDLINYDVLKVNLLDSAEDDLLINVSGGLRVPQTISEDGAWISFLNCRCYSECFGYSLWHIPSEAELGQPEEGLIPGPFSFSPDYCSVTFSRFMGLGFEASPLFVADVNFDDVMTIFEDEGIYPESPIWSPRGDWIAFEGWRVDSEGFDIIDSRIILVKPDGSAQILLEESGADVIAWSPKGDHLMYMLEEGGERSYYVYSPDTGEKELIPLPPASFVLDWGNLP